MISQSSALRPHLWLGLLVVGSVALSLGFACATPFAAFAALAAQTLPRNEAMLAAGGVWFANQAAGFLFLHYPWTANSLAWGVALGVAIIIAAAVARSAAYRLAPAGKITATAGGVVAAFAVHQVFLLGVAAALLGGSEDFAATIVAQIFAVTAATFVGFIVLGWLAGRIGLLAPPTGQPAVR
jgi:hypothetical protein